MTEWDIETNLVQAGYTPKNGEPRVLPIFQSTTFKYDSTEQVAELFDMTGSGHMYSRISNPTVAAVEDKIALLEGGTAAVCTSSGQSAVMVALLNICSAGDHFISVSTIYGGTVNLFAVTLKRMGIEVTFVEPGMSEKEMDALVRPNTKAVFGETIANPALTVLDIERFAAFAHKHSVPLIVDNTFATPYLCRPFEYGADIIIHSTTKYMDGHASTIGGVIVDGGKFDYANGKFPSFTEPDESYHGVIYSRKFPNTAYAAKARWQLIRDIGCYQSAFSAFIINLGLESLHLRMRRHCDNALTAARFLEKHSKIVSINYPLLESSSEYARAQKYLPKGASGVISFDIKGSRSEAVRFMDSLHLAAIVVHVADARTSVLHPATSTHRQLSDEQLAAAGIGASTIRLSCGIENPDDIIADLRQALEKV